MIESVLFNRPNSYVGDVNSTTEQDYLSRIRCIEQTNDFKIWFEGAAMVDEQTLEPLLLLHGTKIKFDKHKLESTSFGEKVDPGYFGHAQYFTSEKEVAQGYTSNRLNDYGFITYSYCNAKKVLTFEHSLLDMITDEDDGDKINFLLLPEEIRERTKEIFLHKLSNWRSLNPPSKGPIVWDAPLTPSESDVLLPYLVKAVHDSAIESGFAVGKGINPRNKKIEFAVYDESTLLTVRRRTVKVL